MERVVVGGALAQRPGYGGHAWALLGYLQGFGALGHDVLFLDRLTAEMAPTPRQRERCIGWLVDVMEAAGMAGSYSLFLDDGTVGLSHVEAVSRVEDSALLLNVMGFVQDPDVLAAASRKAFLDIDPGFGQMWQALGLVDVFVGHDAYVTVGERIGEPDCGIPMCGVDWVTTPHPIVLDQWPVVAEGSRFTSVGAWRGPYDSVEFEGRRFGLRAHELRALMTLPAEVEAEFELALEIDPADAADREALEGAGWHLSDPAVVAADPATYRRYIQSSLAELMVAKGMYVETRGGWLGERSLAYLASGKPVLAQETGFGERYPTGEGLLSFSDLEEARAGVEEILSDPRRHAAAAREIAAEHFEASRVLGRLLEAVA